MKTTFPSNSWYKSSGLSSTTVLNSIWNINTVNYTKFLCLNRRLLFSTDHIQYHNRCKFCVLTFSSSVAATANSRSLPIYVPVKNDIFGIFSFIWHQKKIRDSSFLNNLIMKWKMDAVLDNIMYILCICKHIHPVYIILLT